jgi:uncharacterized protein YceK
MRKVLLSVMVVLLLSGCSVFRKKVKYGCPTDGKNIGAERILSGDKAAIKASRKAKKFSN